MGALDKDATRTCRLGASFRTLRSTLSAARNGPRALRVGGQRRRHRPRHAQPRYACVGDSENEIAMLVASRIGPATTEADIQPATTGPQRRPARVTRAIRVGTSKSFRRKSVEN